MTMRLMFAVATALTPEILLLGEMFSTGDEGFKQKASIRMGNVIDSAKIFVFASHDIDLIKRYCGRIFELKHGHLYEVVI